jgi:hypothetical protein
MEPQGSVTTPKIPTRATTIRSSFSTAGMSSPTRSRGSCPGSAPRCPLAGTRHRQARFASWWAKDSLGHVSDLLARSPNWTSTAACLAEAKRRNDVRAGLKSNHRGTVPRPSRVSHSTTSSRTTIRTTRAGDCARTSERDDRHGSLRGVWLRLRQGVRGRRGRQRHVFDSFECAVHRIAPICQHCRCKATGHGTEVLTAFERSRSRSPDPGRWRHDSIGARRAARAAPVVQVAATARG